VTSPQIGSGAAAATRPPLHDVAHLGHIELLTPKMCESLWFFVEVLGMTETCREGNSVYLRTWDDYEHHTVKLTAHETSGIRRVGLRASSQAALEARVAAIEAAGLGVPGRRRPRYRADLPVPRPGRARARAVLGDRVVRAAR
jgi:hypothetical protein